ncbi:transcriptional regulator with XRE-family HTH domain [Rhodococcus sp. 27YEA15]|uniref:helix-turn-helix domain-containing protein n=1 Tax=Rhodococcus sp. 27YEA15 TaxID=3156259 RepID=UPI003C7B9F03
MNEFSRFIQEQIDIRGWKPAELSARSSLSRQHISKLLNDKRDHLGQMPELKTMEGLATAFEGVSIETIRDVAARALGTVADNDRQTVLDLQQVSIDALLNEIKRRVQGNEDTRTQGTPSDPTTDGEAGPRGAPMNEIDPSAAMRLARSDGHPDDPIGQPLTPGETQELPQTRTSSTARRRR